ncbi:MAG: class I SAM-dependent RNA methyltransferase [Clostridiales bacterium]
METMEMIATSSFGIEAVVSRELKWLGYYDQKVENGKVTFKGNIEALYKSNLWLRSAERVFIKVGEFKAITFDELFEKTKALPWEKWLPENACFPVEGKSISSTLFSVSDCQAIVKKAIVEKMKLKYKKEWFDEDGPRYKIEVGLLKDTATLTIDSSGVGLHKRGYRKLVTRAPLKETLASAILLISRWKDEKYLIDPFCGSGTFPIEAALIAKNIAPGLNREFDFDKWHNFDKVKFNNIIEESKDLIKKDISINIQGSDLDEEVLKKARYHAKLAGVYDDLHFQKRDVLEISSKNKYGFIICNPPYGERVDDETEVEKLYKMMGSVFKEFETWSYYIFTSHENFERIFGKRANKKRKLYNGRKQCNLYQFFGPPPPKKNYLGEPKKII